MTDPTATAFLHETDWIADLIATATRAHLEGLGQSPAPAPPAQGLPAVLPGTESLHSEERLMLALALTTILAPESLDPLSIRNPALDRRFTVFGGQPDASGGFIPTVQTALFLTGTEGPRARLDALMRTRAGARLIRDGLIAPPAGGQSADIRTLLLPGPKLTALLTGAETGAAIPGSRLLRTALEPHDLVLPGEVHQQLNTLISWIEHGGYVRRNWGLSRRTAPGYRALFHGPPGTGKTLAAALLGKRTGLDVYRVDLSAIVSKYIGETEKNLAAVFDLAEAREVILFFDEADALFGKRTDVRSSHDRFANQEVSYLLQRIEETDCLTILASNLRENIDAAFLRRFEAVIWFPMPGRAERRAIWQAVLAEVPLTAPADIEGLSDGFDVSGAMITSAVLEAALAARSEGAEAVGMEHLHGALRRELRKHGKAQGGHD